jgi:plastocyanin
VRRLIFATMTAAAALSTIDVVGALQHTVVQKEKTFSAVTLTIKPGDKVMFKNDDEVTHNVFSNTAGLKFNLTQPPGETGSQVFDSEGTAEVRCAFHPKMKMTIVVKR